MFVKISGQLAACKWRTGHIFGILKKGEESCQKIVLLQPLACDFCMICRRQVSGNAKIVFDSMFLQFFGAVDCDFLRELGR